MQLGAAGSTGKPCSVPARAPGGDGRDGIVCPDLRRSARCPRRPSSPPIPLPASSIPLGASQALPGARRRVAAEQALVLVTIPRVNKPGNQGPNAASRFEAERSHCLLPPDVPPEGSKSPAMQPQLPPPRPRVPAARSHPLVGRLPGAPQRPGWRRRSPSRAERAPAQAARAAEINDRPLFVGPV